MDEIRRLDFDTHLFGPVRSLAWDGDEVRDLAAGDTRFRLDGTSKRGGFTFGFHFDVTVTGPDGIAAVAKRRGTTALVMTGPTKRRQLGRDCYFADAYDYPIALFRGPDGRPLLAHCPQQYTVLHLDDARTGKRLTARRPTRTDYFHSHLLASPSGRWLASHGWVWHPFEAVLVFDVARVLADPALLDRTGWPFASRIDGEVAGIGWAADDHLLVSTTNDDPLGTDEDGAMLLASSIGCFDPAADAWCYRTQLERVAGELLDLGDHRHVVAFDGHPRLLDARTGETLRAWEDLPTGHRASCIDDRDRRPLALDHGHRRFAVGSDERVTIVELG